MTDLPARKLFNNKELVAGEICPVGSGIAVVYSSREPKSDKEKNEDAAAIFNLNGELVRTLIHTETSEGGVGNDLGGDEWWDVLSDTRHVVASGVYIFHVRSDVGEQVGKFVIIR